MKILCEQCLSIKDDLCRMHIPSPQQEVIVSGTATNFKKTKKEIIHLILSYTKGLINASWYELSRKSQNKERLKRLFQELQIHE